MFNLGDRSYGTQFCAAGRKLATRLLQLGSTLYINPIGYGDDLTSNGGVFYDLDEWIYQTLLPSLSITSTPALASTIPTNVNNNAETIVRRKPPYRITTITLTNIKPPNTNQYSNSMNNEEENENTKHTDSNSDSIIQSRMNDFYQKQFPMNAYQYDIETKLRDTQNHNRGNHIPCIGRVIENKRITSNDWKQDTRHLRINVYSIKPNNNAMNNDEYISTPLSMADISLLPYHAGDVASIMSVNSKDNVERFINVLPKRIQDHMDDIIQIEYIDANYNDSDTNHMSWYPGTCYPYWPRTSHITFRNIITYCMDITSLPEREDLHTLSYYCNIINHEHGNNQKEKLLSLCQTKYNALYVDYIIREKRTWIDVLYDFDSIRYHHIDDTTTTTTDTTKQFNELTMEVLLALIPPIRPRDYSIASSPTMEHKIRRHHDDSTTSHDNVNNDDTNTDDNMCNGSSSSSSSSPMLAEMETSKPLKQQIIINNEELVYITTIELCVAIVQGMTPLGRNHYGLCTNFLANLKPHLHNHNDDMSVSSSFLHLWIKPGSFQRLPLEMNYSIHEENDEDDDNHDDDTMMKTRTAADHLHSIRYQVPILCIGSGTGIAPLRSLLLERLSHLSLKRQEQQQQQHSLFIDIKNVDEDSAKNHDDIPMISQMMNGYTYFHMGGDNDNDNCTNHNNENDDNVLIFGCRKQLCDFYYKTEWVQFTSNPFNNFHLISSFSQEDQKSYRQQHQEKIVSGKKTYVQHVLQCLDNPMTKLSSSTNVDDHFLLNFLLQRNGYIYIAGNPNMARSVKETITEILNTFYDDERKTQLYLTKLQREGRLVIEAWG